MSTDPSKNEFVYFFASPFAPEKFLVKAYLDTHPNEALSVFLSQDNHHALFSKMVDLGLATDVSDARSLCYSEFEKSKEYQFHFDGLRGFLMETTTKFSDPEFIAS
jgi:hypothetical protein